MATRSSEQSQYVAATPRNGTLPSETAYISPRRAVDQQPPVSSADSNIHQAWAHSATVSDITDDVSTPLAASKKEKIIATQESPEIVRHCIHWLSPTWMIVTFFAGLLLSVGHHLYYHSLDGQVVGNSQRQQWALRLGNLFAFLVKSCLATSAGIAYVQRLWKTLRRKYITVGGINAAFSIRGNILSFFNWEMLSEIKVGTLMALVVWCMPIVVLITPATLSVEVSPHRIVSQGNVATLDISNFHPLNLGVNEDEAWSFVDRFAEVSVDGDPLSDNTPYSVSGTSNRLARLVAATATSGEILPITNPLPGLDATYQMDLHLPSLKCETSSDAIALNTTILAVISSSQEAEISRPFNLSELDIGQLTYGSARPVLEAYIGYFAMVPEYNYSGMPIPMESLVTKNMVASQLRIAIADHAKDGSTIPRFFTCQLWNASLSLNISYLNDVQTLRHDHFTYINEIDPDTTIREHGIPRNMATMSCEAFFWEVCQQLTGLIAFSSFQFINHANIRNTILNSASEFSGIFNIFTAMEHGVILKNETMADMAHGMPLDNKNISQISASSLNKSLNVLIEEFALNASLNLLTDAVLSVPTSAAVTHSIVQNIYTYDPSKLVIAYSLAIFCTLLIILLGGFTYRSNGASYKPTMSSIISTTQTPDLANLFRRQSGGAQPLDPQIAKTKLRSGIVDLEDGDAHGVADAQRGRRRVAFGLEGTVVGISEKVRESRVGGGGKGGFG